MFLPAIWAQTLQVSRLILRSLQAEYTQWILWIPVFFAVGIGIYFTLTTEPPFLLTYFIAVIGLISSIISWRWHNVFWVCLLLSMIGFGFFNAQLQTIRSVSPVLQQKLALQTIEGTIERIDYQRQHKRLILTDLLIPSLVEQAKPHAIRLQVSTPSPPLQVGYRVSMDAILAPIPNTTHPKGYSLKRGLYFQQIGGTGYATSPVSILSTEKTHYFTSSITAIRLSIRKELFAMMDPRYAAIAAALIIGDQQAIFKEDVETMRVTGLAHLLSISGMHLVLVATICFYMSRLLFALSPTLALHYPIKQWAALIALAGSLFYLLISGMPVSANRAFIMTALVLIAILLERSPCPIRSAAFAAFVILLYQPSSLMSASFQMSFAAAIALISSFEYLSSVPYLQPGNRSLFGKIGCYILSLFSSSLIASCATAPFTIYHFHQVSNISVLANMVAVPFSSFMIMPLCVISLVSMMFQLAYLPLQALELSLVYLIEWSNWIGQIPFAAMQTINLHVSSLILLVLGGLWICLWQTKIRFLGLLFLCMAPLGHLKLQTYPDIIINGNGQFFAVRSKEGELYFSTAYPGNYLKNNWQNAYASQQTDIIKNATDSALQCDEMGCVYQKHDQQIALTYHPLGLKADCQNSTALINLSFHNTSCPHLLLDHQALWQNGTYEIYVEENGIILKNVKETEGIRPWNG